MKKNTWTLKDVAAHWDSEPKYDAINAKIDSYFRRFTDSAPLFTIPPNAKVLDVDCRTAKGTSYFQKKYPTAEFTCVAMSPTFKERSLRALRENGLGAEVAVFERIPLPFGNESFDVILSYETLEHLPVPEEFITELARMLKPGGTLVLTTPNVLWEPIHWLSAALHLDHGEGPHRMVPRKEIYDGFHRAGLEVMEERSFVLVPVGPKFLLSFGKFLERISPEWLKRILCLRRTFICMKP